MALVVPSSICPFDSREDSDVVEAFLGRVTTGFTDWN
jgi:hypothetical protein